MRIRKLPIATTDILLEAAYFDQLSVRNTARKLKLFSPSSFRFERNIDSANLDWASRRACELIVQIAGGEVCDGIVDAGEQPAKPADVTLRFAQLERLLGITIPNDFSKQCLESLGAVITKCDDTSVTVTPPSWRKDLTREVDLIEEVGRVYGFDKIPDDGQRTNGRLTSSRQVIVCSIEFAISHDKLAVTTNL